MKKTPKEIINNFLPGDQYFDHFCVVKSFKRTHKIGEKEYGKKEYLYKNYFNYNGQMLENKKVGQTELYEFISFNNIISGKMIVFLKFENIYNYKKWRNKKPKKSIIKKIYHVDGKVQVNLEIGNVYFHKIRYFDNVNEIGIMKAKQLDLTI